MAAVADDTAKGTPCQKPLPTSVYRTSLDRVALVKQLVQRGYAVIDGLLTPKDGKSALLALLSEARQAAAVPDPTPNVSVNLAAAAATAVVESTGQDLSIRRDLTYDIDPLDDVKLPLLAKAARTLQFLVGGAVDQFMPQCLYTRERPQFAYYAGNGSFYRRHFDNPRNLPNGTDNLRRITILLYLNEDWPDNTGVRAGTDTNDVLHGALHSHEASSSNNDIGLGGELRLLVHGPTDFDVKIAPVANRCVVFFSDLIEHEVLPSYGHRLAITVWLSEYFNTQTDESEALMRKFFVLQARQVAEAETTL